MTRKLLTASAWKSGIRTASVAEAAELGLMKDYVSGFKAVEGQERTLEFVISDESIDRDRDVIKLAGWDLKNYRKNPVVLFAHNSYDLPIARALSVRKEESKLIAVAKFTDADENPMGDRVYRLCDGKFLNAASVGFIPRKYAFVDDDEDRRGGIDIEKCELLEFSIVPIPANPNALMRAHELGIDTGPLKAWAAKILDEPLRGLGRNDLENAWKQLRDEPVVIDLGACKCKGATIECELKGFEVEKDGPEPDPAPVLPEPLKGLSPEQAQQFARAFSALKITLPPVVQPVDQGIEIKVAGDAPLSVRIAEGRFTVTRGNETTPAIDVPVAAVLASDFDARTFRIDPAKAASDHDFSGDLDPVGDLLEIDLGDEPDQTKGAIEYEFESEAELDAFVASAVERLIAGTSAAK